MADRIDHVLPCMCGHTHRVAVDYERTGPYEIRPVLRPEGCPECHCIVWRPPDRAEFPKTACYDVIRPRRWFRPWRVYSQVVLTEDEALLLGLYLTALAGIELRPAAADGDAQ